MAANITEPAANTTTIVPINGTWEDFMIANFNFLGLVIAGLVWGITNPFLEKGSKDSTEEEFDLSLKSLLKTIFNYKFIIPFVINQLGSIIYYYFLGKSSFSIGPLIANTVAFPASYIVEKSLKKRRFTKEAGIGIVLIFIGIYLCAVSVSPTTA